MTWKNCLSTDHCAEHVLSEAPKFPETPGKKRKITATTTTKKVAIWGNFKGNEIKKFGNISY